MIDIESCKQAIQSVKNNINACFTLCDKKGSTYSQTNNTTGELYQKIAAITTADGGGSGGSGYGNGMVFNGFAVSSTNDQSLTINCGSVGVAWRGIAVYSNDRRGFFSIHKIDASKCIVSGMPWYYYDDGSTVGAFPYSLEATAAMCSYAINGSTITLNVITYSIENPADIGMLGNQISNESNYMLNLIDIY